LLILDNPVHPENPVNPVQYSMTPIPLYNRRTGQLEHEVVYEPAVMEFLFGTRLGLWLSETVLKHRWVTQVYARRMHSPRSKPKIKEFIERYGINTDEIARPVESFHSFNEFFIRQLKPAARPIDREPAHLISIADARLIAYPIKADTVVPVKGRSFTLADLLRDAALAKRYDNGLCLIFRLAPVDYHRFAYVDDGEQSPVRVINGYYRSVNPLALWRNLNVFPENQREVCVLHTRNFGDVLHIDVGATSVGHIVQHQRDGGAMQRGAEKGYFEFGGSTSILLLEAGRIEMDEDIAIHSAQGVETIVRYGERIARQFSQNTFLEPP
jgi:phosphatidylserine decarboxylase